METMTDFMPKSRKVAVGKETLAVDEFTVAKRDAVVKVLLDKLDAAKIVGPFLETMRSSRRANAEMMAEMTRVSAEMKKAGKSDDDIRNKLADVLAEQRKALADSDEMDVGAVAGQIKELVLKLLSNDLTLVSCLALDTLDNRKRAGLDNPKQTATDKAHGYEYCPAMFEFVKNSLTLPQEQQVLKAVVEVNDVVGLVKNYWTPVAKLLSEKKEDEAGEPAEQNKTG